MRAPTEWIALPDLAHAEDVLRRIASYALVGEWIRGWAEDEIQRLNTPMVR